MKRLYRGLYTAVLCAAVAGVVSPVRAMTLAEAISYAVAANPQIGEAIYNREAIGFELKQGKGQFLPRVDIEASLGRGEYRTPATIPNGLEDDFNRNEARVVVSQRLFDGFASLSEVQKQAARLDSASHRVFERSEFIALAVAREYVDIVRLRNLVTIAQNNLNYHNSIAGDVRKATSGGATSIADQQQAQERVLAARARIEQIRDDLSQAEARFIQLVGLPIGRTASIPSIGSNIPRTIDEVLGVVRAENPLLKIRNADLDASLAQVKGAESNFYPTVSAEASARRGRDVDNVQGRVDDYRVGVVARWNVFNGGIDVAKRESQVRRSSEARMAIHTAHREVEQEARTSWDRRNWLRRQRDTLNQQAQISRQLLGSYREQFNIGSRSLLDLLNTQNTAYTVEAAAQTAHYAAVFTEYRLLASMGRLVKTFDVAVSKAAAEDVRPKHLVKPTPDSETMHRMLDPWAEVRPR